MSSNLGLQTQEREPHLFKGEVIIDPVFNKKGHTSVKHPVQITKQILPQANGSSARYGADNIFELDSYSTNYECVLRATPADTTTEDYSDYALMSAIDRVKILSNDGRKICEYDYNVVMKKIFKNMSVEAVSDLLTAAGGTNYGQSIASNTEYVYAFIPTPWSACWQQQNGGWKRSTGLPVHMLDTRTQQVRIVIKLRTLATFLKPTATGGGLSDLNLVTYNARVPTSVVNEHVNDRENWELLVSVPQTLEEQAVTSTASNIDIKELAGRWKSLTLSMYTQTDETTNYIYFENEHQNLSEIHLRVNGDNYYSIEYNTSQREALCDQLFMAGDVSGRTVYEINFAVDNESNVFAGSLDTRDAAAIQLYQATSSGTDYMDVLAEKIAFLRCTKDGKLVLADE